MTCSFLFQRFADVLQEQRREGTVHHLLAVQLLDVYGDNLRQLYLFIAFFQFHEAILTGCGIVPSLYRRGCRTQQSFGAVHGGEYNGCIASMIARGGVLLLVGVFVLLVHNHETEVAERKEDGGADAENNVIVCFRQLLLPDFHPFGIGELGVIDAQSGAEYALQALCDLCSESYFGQEIEHLLSLPDGFFYQMNIDFGLAACRDAMQQADVLALKIL